MKKNVNKIALILNIIIVIFVVMASIMMFIGYKFMPGEEIVLESSKIGMFKFFTVDSNILMGIISFIFIIYDIKLLNGKIKEIPKSIYIWKLMATTGVTLTFLVVFSYLGPLAGSMYKMIMNSNLFFHLIVPVLSMTTFILFEKNNKLSFKYSFFGLIPVIIYGLLYLINVLMHMENGVVSPIYDFYWFVQNGVWTTIIVIPIMIIIAYTISFVLWKLNNKKIIKE